MDLSREGEGGELSSISHHIFSREGEVALYIGSHELGVVWGCLDKIHGPSPAEHAGPFDLDSLGPDYPGAGLSRVLEAGLSGSVPER